MIVDKMEMEDLLLDQSFINYCNQSSAKDVTYWENYIKMNPARAELLINAKEQFVQLFNALAAADLEEQVTRLNNSLDGSPAAPVIRMEQRAKKKTGSIFKQMTKITAASVLLAGVYFGTEYFIKDRSGEMKTFEAAYGERKNIQLPDGSYVTLNAGSSIKIKDNFGINSRDVCLQGEAFFDVKHNAQLPFIVHTHAMDVKAVGTAFNVKAYRDEVITETSLIRGIVEVTLKEDNNLKMLLFPNEKIKWKSDGTNKRNPPPAPAANTNKVTNETASLKEKMVTTYDGVVKEIAWKANKLIFEDEQFDEIAMLLERWYGVKINFKESTIRNYHFTGIFEKEDLHTVLEFLKESRNFNYTIESGESLTVNLFK